MPGQLDRESGESLIHLSQYMRRPWINVIKYNVCNISIGKRKITIIRCPRSARIFHSINKNIRNDVLCQNDSKVTIISITERATFKLSRNVYTWAICIKL